MIDVESQIYTPIAEALRAQFPGILVSGEYVNAPTRFPYVSLVEQDNYTTEAHMDSGDTERFATLMYSVFSSAERLESPSVRILFFRVKTLSTSACVRS